MKLTGRYFHTQRRANRSSSCPEVSRWRGLQLNLVSLGREQPSSNQLIWCNGTARTRRTPSCPRLHSTRTPQLLAPGAVRFSMTPPSSARPLSARPDNHRAPARIGLRPLYRCRAERRSPLWSGCALPGPALLRRGRHFRGAFWALTGLLQRCSHVLRFARLTVRLKLSGGSLRLNGALEAPDFDWRSRAGVARSLTADSLDSSRALRLRQSDQRPPFYTLTF